VGNNFYPLGETMQKLAIVAALTFVSLATLHSANAADMGARPLAYAPPPPPPPAFSWTGFYIGGNVGGGSSTDRFNGTQSSATTFPAFPFLGSFPSTTAFSGNADGNGAIAGGQIGFNYEFPFSHVVIGIEGDGDWSNIASGGNSCSTITSGAPLFVVGATAGCATVNRTLDSFETIRGRLGYAFNTNSIAFPSVLLYATGGAAWGHENGNFTTTCLGATCPAGPGLPITSGGTAQFSNNLDTGWVAGAGFEWVVYEHWTWRFEYLHLQFPNVSTNFTTTTNALAAGIPGGSSTALTQHTSSNVGVDVLRIGVNYLFHVGGPSYAF
jgi:outer membrane immunogenic protein